MTDRITAEELGEKIKEISIAEFFEKNKHLLGYENPTRSLITVVKEAVENSLDACEEAGILPDIFVSLKEIAPDRFKIIVEDNGPGIIESKVPVAFAKFLVGSKFYRLRQSLTKDEKILIKKDNVVRLVKIGEFVDSFMKKDGIKDISSLGIETPSFNLKTYKIEWKPITHVIKHKLEDSIYQIVLESGRSVKVTGSHSIFVLDINNLVVTPKKTTEIEEGDYVAVARSLPSLENNMEINVFDYISFKVAKRHRWYVYGLGKEVFEHIKRIGERAKIKKHTYLFFKTPYGQIKLRSDNLISYEKRGMLPFHLVLALDIARKFDLRNCRIKTYQVGGKAFEFPVVIRIDTNFVRFIGLWVAEGYAYNRKIIFDFGINEEKYVKEIGKISNKIFLSTNVRIDKKKNKQRVVIGSPILYHLFKGMGLKTGAKRKEIPSFVFNLDKNLKLEFLKSLYQGGGCFVKGKRTLVYTTVSKNLATDLLFLYLTLGVFATLSVKSKKDLGKRSSTTYIILVYGKELNKLLFDVSVSGRSCCKYTKLPSILLKSLGKYNDLPERISLEDAINYLRFGQDRTKDYFALLKSIQSGTEMPQISHKYFFISQLQNSDLITKTNDYALTDSGIEFLWRIEKLKRIIDSDFCFLKVKKIKKVKSKEKYVYDISVPGCENFVSGLGGIVCHNSRGIQGIGIHGAVLYSQLTTGKPVKVISSTGKDIHEFELMIDVLKNEPKVISHKKEKNPKNWHGVRIELEVEGKYVRGSQSVIEYLKQTAIANPFAKIVFDGPDGRMVFERAVKELPKQPKEIKPHPYGVELGILGRMLSTTRARNLIGFLTSEFSRVGRTSAEQICRLAKLDPSKKPQELSHEEIERLHKAMQMVKLKLPPTDCLSPLGEHLIIEGLKKEVDAEYFVAVTRPPSVYRGYPFVVEVGLCYGGNLPTDKPAKIYRFANKIPLLYNQSGCALTESVCEVDWRRYGLSQSEGSLPVGPLAILVHFISVWVPFTSEGKQAIANYPEIMKEVKLALQDAGRKLAKYVRKIRMMKERELRKNIFERYLPVVAESVGELTGRKAEEILSKLRNMMIKGEKLERSSEKA